MLKTANDRRISDWSSDVGSSVLAASPRAATKAILLNPVMPFRWDGGGGATRSGGSLEGGMPAGPVSAAAASAAGATHVTWDGRPRLPAVDHEVMALRLAGTQNGRASGRERVCQEVYI